MKEFIKIKGSGGGEMVIRAALVLRVYDRAEGGAVIEYGESLDRSGANYEVFRTDSTAAEVLAAIEGAQGPTLVVMSRQEYEQQYGAMRYYHTNDGQVKQDSISILAGPAITPTAHYSPLRPGDVDKSPDALLAVGILKNKLAMELENQTGFRWGLSIQRLENSTAFFRCSPEKSTQYFDTKNFCHVALEDETEEALDEMVREMAVWVIASWQLRGR